MYDDFDNKILKDIQERESVLFEIERALFTKRYNLSMKHQEIFWAQSISMVYSIWEGFIQTVFNFYIDGLNNLEIEIYDFCDEIIIHHMENAFKQLRGYPNNDSQKIRFLRDLKTFHNSSEHSISRVINTQSNVGFKVLNKLLKTFSLEPFPRHWKTYTHPNSNLNDTLVLFLRLRNTIAHGGDLMTGEKVTQIEYDRFKSLVRDLMYEVRLKMLYGFKNETFKKRI